MVEPGLELRLSGSRICALNHYTPLLEGSCTFHFTQSSPSLSSVWDPVLFSFMSTYQASVDFWICNLSITYFVRESPAYKFSIFPITSQDTYRTTKLLNPGTPSKIISYIYPRAIILQFLPSLIVVNYPPSPNFLWILKTLFLFGQ